MKLLHLSDLHLGKKLNEASLLEDQRHILRQILRLMDQHRPDGVLIAGDVYDRAVPSAEAVALLDWFFTELSARNTVTVVISGNHDSAERLAFGSRLFTASRIHLSPVYDAAHADIAPVRLTDAHGPVDVWPLPFIKPAHVRSALPDADPQTYTEALAAVVGTLALDPAARNVLLCHQFITGGQRSDSEDVPLGGLDNVDASVFDAFDYVALGHLHRPQRVKRDTVRYCGSPLKYSFSEADDRKSVTLVELRQKGDITLQALPLEPLHDLRRLRGAYQELTLRKNYLNTAREDYLAITLTDEYDEPDALSKLQSIYPNLLQLEYDNARTSHNRQIDAAQGPERHTPVEWLADFYRLQNNQPMDEAQQRYALREIQRIWEERA